MIKSCLNCRFSLYNGGTAYCLYDHHYVDKDMAAECKYYLKDPDKVNIVIQPIVSINMDTDDGLFM